MFHRHTRSSELCTMFQAKAYSAASADTPLAPVFIERREPGEKDVVIDIAYCGVCHSDLHAVRNDWGRTRYPIVPGHEIVGTVAAVGSGVTAWRVGQTVGVGCMVNSCGHCGACQDHEEQFCERGMTATYNSIDKYGDRTVTKGGYSTRITVNERFVLGIPAGMPLDRTAPLLCAGITTYSPLKRFSAGPGMFRERANSFHLLLDTVSAQHDYNEYLGLLDRGGTMVLVGMPEPSPVRASTLIDRRRQLAGSLIGGVAETQEMLDFCARHSVLCDIELIPIDQINLAYERMLKSDVRYRFVIDMQSLRNS